MVSRANLECEAVHVGLRVVSGKRGQVGAGDGAQQPGSLPVLLHTAACLVCLGTALWGSAELSQVFFEQIADNIVQAWRQG